MKKHRTLGELGLEAMQHAVARVIEEHRRNGTRLAVWRDGKVVMLDPWKVKSPVRAARGRRSARGAKARG
jgi:hypothetical protein